MLKSTLAKLVGLSAACIGLGGCAYGAGTGYYDDSGYEYGYNDPYCSDYDSYDYYYDCDSRAGFANIGYSGGYYNDFYYPGSGIFIFDRGGHRYRMDDRYRRYWARQRYGYYAQHRGNRRYRGGVRGRDQRTWTPEERAERRERRADRRDRRGEGTYGRGQRPPDTDTIRQGRRGGNAGNVGRGRRGNGTTTLRGRRPAPSGVTTTRNPGGDTITRPRGRMVTPPVNAAPRTSAATPRRPTPTRSAPRRAARKAQPVQKAVPAPKPAAPRVSRSNRNTLGGRGKQPK